MKSKLKDMKDLMLLDKITLYVLKKEVQEE